VCKLYLFCAKLYCYLLPVWLYRMFPHYKRHNFPKEFIEHKIVFWFLLQHFSL
jgi:hypothetical protein